MPITPLAPERIAETQAILRAQLRVATPSSVVRNATLAADLDVTTTLVYRRRLYKVPPVSFRVGIELQEIAARLDELTNVPETDESLTELLAMFQDAVALFHRCIVPSTFIGRLFWRRRSNPFYNATSGEVAELLGFFSQCRTRSSVRVLPSDSVRARLKFRSTQSTTSSDSRALSLVT